MEPLWELLGNNPIFAKISEGERDALIKRVVDRELERGEALALQGDVWPYLFLIGEGEVEAVKVSNEGRSLSIASFKAGELFWGVAFFQEGAPLPVTLQARCPTRLFQWTRQDIEPIFLRHGSATWELCRLMIERMQRASAIVEELAFQPVAGRLARLLLEDFKNAGDAAISRRLTLDEMAARVGTTREMVCRVLYRFMDKKLVEVTRTEFVLTDEDGLAHIADRS